MDISPSRASPVEFLLVEDDRGDVRRTQDALHEGKVRNRVRVAPDGATALRLLREDETARPDVVLLDMGLGGAVDGRTLLRAVESDPRLRDIAVVVLVDSRLEAEELRARGVRACCFVTKPVDFREMTTIVQARADLALAMVRANSPAG